MLQCIRQDNGVSAAAGGCEGEPYTDLAMGDRFCVQVFFKSVLGWSVGNLVNFSCGKYGLDLAIRFYSINASQLHCAVLDGAGSARAFPVVKVVVRARCRRDGEFVVVVNFAMYSDLL